MALTCNFCPHISSQRQSLIVKPLGKALRFKQKRNSIIKQTVLPSLKIRSSFREKVFEDRSNGVVCYTDESGEIVCEGIDEGPRYHQPLLGETSAPSDAEIFDILQQRLINIVRRTDQIGVAVQGDIGCNGFNSLH